MTRGKQKTAYEILRSDWSSDVCSSDLTRPEPSHVLGRMGWAGAKPTEAHDEERTRQEGEIGRASCRERVYVLV